MTLDNPSAQELLGRLQKATGVVLSLDAPLQGSDLRFGSYTTESAPAWKIMEEIALTDVVDGRWQKTEEGYCLIGKRQGGTTAPAVATNQGGWPFKGVLLAAAGIALLLAAGFLILSYSSARKKQQSGHP